MHHIITSLTDPIARHPDLAVLAVFLSAALESIVLIGTAVPGTAILVALSTLIGLGKLPLWPVMAAAALGAMAGDGLSYGIGRHHQGQITKVWPFSRWPGLIERGQTFFDRYGAMSIVIARFMPGVRAVLPVMVGSSGVPPRKFFPANIAAALIWAPAHVLPGALAGLGLGVAGHMSLRLAGFALILLAAVVVAVLALRLLIGLILPWAERLRARLAQHLRAGRQTRLTEAALVLVDPDEDLRPILLIGLPLAIAAVSFVSLAQEVAERGGLVRADAAISHALTRLRTDPGDEAMIFVTAFGDWPVVTVTVAALVLWLILRGKWHLGLGLAAIMGLSIGVASALKVLFAIPRPSDIYAGVQAFSFPSGHATSAMTLFGLLAWFAWRGLPHPWKRILPGIFAAIAAVIAVSRLYLTAHWPSDVLGGLLLGMVLVLLFALAFRREIPDRAGTGLALALTVFVGFGTVYSLYTMPRAEQRYARISPPPVAMTHDEWLRGGWRELPRARIDLAGANEDPIVLQWAGSALALTERLRADGWIVAEPLNLSTLGRYLSVSSPADLPVIARLNDGRRPVLILIRPTASDREILTAWESGVRVGGVPVLIAAVEQEKVTHPLSFLTYGNVSHTPAPAPLTGTDTIREDGITLAPR